MSQATETGEAAGMPGEAAGMPVHCQTSPPHRILVMEDEPDVRCLNGKVLKGSGYEVQHDPADHHGHRKIAGGGVIISNASPNRAMQSCQ